MLAQLFLSFLQVGAFSIGGGYAAMPLIQSQVVERFGWLTMEEFTNLITIAEMTPGPISVNSATFVGLRVDGVAGAADCHLWVHSAFPDSGIAALLGLCQIPQRPCHADRALPAAPGGGGAHHFGGAGHSLYRRAHHGHAEPGKPFRGLGERDSVRRGAAAATAPEGRSHCRYGRLRRSICACCRALQGASYKYLFRGISPRTACRKSGKRHFFEKANSVNQRSPEFVRN